MGKMVRASVLVGWGVGSAIMCTVILDVEPEEERKEEEEEDDDEKEENGGAMWR
jgi:hypothetical protein